MNRTIYIGNPAYLKCKNKQLKVTDPESGMEIGSVPIEDIAFLVLDHPQITLSHYLMVRLIEARAAIISCDNHHLPHSLQLPFAGHTEHTERVLQQTQMSEPLKKQLWKQTVEEKIHNQGRLLKKLGLDAEPMFEWQNEVKSGDTTNREGVAAKYYWEQLFDIPYDNLNYLSDDFEPSDKCTGFVRDRFGDSPNDLLNFGYAILRSVVARALSSAGFHLALGIHHKSKYNATCLADDIMEPFRPFVDEMIIEYLQKIPNYEKLDKTAKAYLLSLMQKDIHIDTKVRPLQVAATITAASLYKCAKGDYRLLRYPELI